jgi:hypothetical protein
MSQSSRGAASPGSGAPVAGTEIDLEDAAAGGAAPNDTASTAGAGGNGNRPTDGGTDGGDGPDRGSGTPEPTELDQEIFYRDLNEVHLLIDFVSGRSDKNLRALKVPDTEPISEGETRSELDATETVRRITLIRYPPTPEHPFTAANATLLLFAKDRLSELSSPARGLTIA